MPIIGREPPADIVIPMPQVSARHAEVRHVQGEHYSIVDLGSSNGTFVNGQRIQSATVRLTDRVSLGSLDINLTAFQSLLKPASRERSAEVSAAPTPLAKSEPAPGAAPVQSRPIAEPGLGTELAVALASQRSFVGPAFMTFFLYWLMWIPGLVMNCVYLSEAGRIRKMTGQSPSGMGCLQFLLWVYVILPLIGVLLIVLSGGALLARIGSSLR